MDGHREMLLAIDADMRALSDLLGMDALSSRVMTAMAQVPRDAFVPARVRDHAYVNHALPIGHGQTISQPFIVALMTELLAVGPDADVLEIGTGSGYQAAVLAELVAQVYTIEVIPELAHEAQARLEHLGYTNVEVKIGDGHLGWPEHAPFDGIVVTAAADEVPPLLVAQLSPGARMVIPIGPADQTQKLSVIEKAEDGAVSTSPVLDVAFVPFTGQH